MMLEKLLGYLTFKVIFYNMIWVLLTKKDNFFATIQKLISFKSLQIQEIKKLTL